MRWIYSFMLLFGIAVLLILNCADKNRHLQPAKTDQKDKTNFAQAADTKSLPQRRGMIRGRVIYQGNPPQPQKLLVVKDNAVCNRVDHYDERLVVGPGNGIKDAVVSLVIVAGGQSLGAMGTEFVLDQTDCRFQPHVLLIPVKTPVQVLNNDGILHNFHTYSMRNGRVNIAQPPVTRKIKKAFKYPEKISVRCDLHGWMHSWIIVVAHPYHAVTDADGRFSIPDIPPGTYSIQSWQEVLGEQTVQVTVTTGSPVIVDFTYRPEDRAGRSP